MINFIICDDNNEIVEEVAEIIDYEMMKNKNSYKKHMFNDYDSSFIKLMQSKTSSKVYILDIETPTYSGIDIARMIRENDIDSVIIFLTSHNELGYNVLKGEYLFLSFINKFDDYHNKLSRSIRKSLEVLNSRNVIRFEDGGSLYTIPVNNVLYVTRDSVERKVIIVTDTVKYSINKSLIEMIEILGKGFVQTHRSCIVNTNRVNVVNYSKKQIIFDNGLIIDLISTKYKEQVIT